MESNRTFHPLSAPAPPPPPSSGCTLASIHKRAQLKKRRRRRGVACVAVIACCGWWTLHASKPVSIESSPELVNQPSVVRALPIADATSDRMAPFQVTAKVVRLVPLFQATSDSDAYQLVGYQPEVEWVDLGSEAIPVETQEQIETVMQADKDAYEFTL